ncbi:MAG: hypothetical protein II886_05600 [Prevotella sp.]|nr:hypothetical protein [Prevotella sp.]
MKELGFLFVTQFMSLEPGKVTTQNGEEWGTFHRQFLIPQTATFCIAMNANRNSSFAAKIKKGVKNMRSTFKIMCLITTALIIRTLEVAPLGIGNGLETT